jgi:hypothetical protein
MKSRFEGIDGDLGFAAITPPFEEGFATVDYSSNPSITPLS